MTRFSETAVDRLCNYIALASWAIAEHGIELTVDDRLNTATRILDMFVLSKGKPKTANLIMDKPNKRFGEKITGTGRNPDGTLKQHTAVKNKTNRVVKEFGVRTNVWLYNVGKWKVTKDDYAYKHPAIFPEQLVQDHILTWSNPGDVVLDPFLGSGTTAKMAVLNDRHYIGFELSSEYFDIACRRLDEVERVNFFNQKVQDDEQQ